MDVSLALNYQREYWEKMNDEQIETFKDELINHYRSRGFPYFDIPLDMQKKELDKMDRYCKSNRVIENGIIKQTMHCLNVAWHYFPHAFDLKCNSGFSPLEAFNDDILLRKAINKRLKYGSNFTDAMLRKTLKASSGVNAVSNFRPSASRAIYDKWGGDVVYDPSAGFGGRLLGAISSPKVKHYIACEPSTLTFEGLNKIVENFGQTKKITIHKIGSEDFIPNTKVDLVFTSPPYFNNEKYSMESTQSYIKFPTKQEWLNGFLLKTISNAISVLKDGGYLIINIANVKSYPNLVQDFLDGVKEVKLVQELKLQLSKHGGYKYEPVFVFKK